MRIPYYLSPRYHLVRLRQDLVALQSYASIRKSFDLRGEREAVAYGFRGKLFGCFFLSGATSFSGTILGAVLQGITHSSWVGLFSTILIGNTVSTSAYQAVWWWDNRRLYSEAFSGGFRRFWEMERDLFPVHFTGIRLAFLFGLLTVPLNAFVILLLWHYFPKFAIYVPAGLIVCLVDLLLVHSMFIRIMGDRFDQHSWVLADKYRLAAAED